MFKVRDMVKNRLSIAPTNGTTPETTGDTFGGKLDPFVQFALKKSRPCPDIRASSLRVACAGHDQKPLVRRAERESTLHLKIQTYTLYPQPSTLKPYPNTPNPNPKPQFFTLNP